MKNLEDLKGMKSGFSTPEGYLEGLKGRLDRLPERVDVKHNENEEAVPRSFWMLMKPQLSLAASFVLMAVLGFGLVYLVQQWKQPEVKVAASAQAQQEVVVPERTPDNAELSDEGIIQYLSESDLDHYYLANKH